jgi:hypothetical protein
MLSMWVVAAMLKELLVPRVSEDATGVHYPKVVLTATSLLLLATSAIEGFDIRECKICYIASACKNTTIGSFKRSNI